MILIWVWVKNRHPTWKLNETKHLKPAVHWFDFDPKPIFGVPGPLLLWMDKILHHLRIPGMMIPPQIPTNNGFPWFRSGAKWILSIHSRVSATNQRHGPSVRAAPTARRLRIFSADSTILRLRAGLGQNDMIWGWMSKIGLNPLV